MDNVTPRTAARLIAGMTQGTRDIGTRWDTLSEESRSELIHRWEREISDRPTEAADLIVASIASHSELAAAWNGLGEHLHQNRVLLIQTIISNTVHEPR
jgi:hypothetical protein